MLLLGLSEKNFPKPARGLPAEAADEFLLRERALLHVAASRARDELVLTWSGRLSPLLPV